MDSDDAGTDGVIAENGAVVHFPDSDHTSLLGPLIPESFIADSQVTMITSLKTMSWNRYSIDCGYGHCN